MNKKPITRMLLCVAIGFAAAILLVNLPADLQANAAFESSFPTYEVFASELDLADCAQGMAAKAQELGIEGYDSDCGAKDLYEKLRRQHVKDGAPYRGAFVWKILCLTLLSISAWIIFTEWGEEIILIEKSKGG